MNEEVLIVDDNIEVGQYILSVLRDAGFKPEYFSSSLLALERLRLKKFDLIITDILIPKMDGLELIKQSKKLKNPPMILAISGGKLANGPDTKTCLDRARKLDINAFIEKPFYPEELISKLEHLFKNAA